MGYYKKTCKTCINLCNKRGEVCGKLCENYKGEVQEMLREIDIMLEDMEEEFWAEQERLREEEKITKLLEEGYMDFERNEIGGANGSNRQSY